ncbi:MAG: sugar phosphate isomerase/epimerase [Acidobacteriota bacterium]|nr:sugar phosphate isomerase/epimerase [Acidobacteriota bacterium]
MPAPIRHAMCNEAFGETPFAESCRVLRSAGYAGIEIAPFTLAPDPLGITPERRRELRAIMQGEGIAFVGLHWLMVSPAGLHVTTPDDALRARSWRHIRDLIGLCADLGEKGVMIFGSPKQRSTTGGLTREQATRHYVEGLREVAGQAADRGVTVLVEALPKSQSDVVRTLAEAAAIVFEIGSPAVQTMFDVHNAEDETVPHTELLEKYFDIIRHVHVNEMDGRYPGTGDYDFGSLLRRLCELNYEGWVSLEVFDFKPDAASIARASIEYLKNHE